MSKGLVPIYALVVLAVTGAAQILQAQIYSENIDDIAGTTNHRTALGQLDDYSRAIDLRGFVPFSFWSRELQTNTSSLLPTQFRWFKIPPREGIQFILYGPTSTNALNTIPIVTEASVKSEDEQWVRLAYGLCKAGAQLYKESGGGSGLRSSQPILILIGENTVLIVINFGYNGVTCSDTGQYLVAYEFSKRFKEYKMMYGIYDTFFMKVSTKDAFKATYPLIHTTLELMNMVDSGNK